MLFIYLIFIVFIALCLGSFLSVIVFRLDEKEGILMGRSECPECEAKLKWYDLVPIFSFLALKGKCRYCKTKISYIYPAMEVITAISFVSYFLIHGFYIDARTIYELMMIFLLLALVFFDYLYFVLPDKLIFSALALAIIYTGIFNKSFALNGFITGLAISLFFGIIYLISRGEWIGFGDVKLGFLIGFSLGYPVALFSILFSVWAGAFVGMAMIAKGRAGLKTPLPFGSFMGIVTVIFIIFSEYGRYFSKFL